MEIQQPNILGQYLAGKQAGQEAQKRNFLSQNGAAIMQGDQNALAQFAQLDPEGAMGIMARQQEQAYRQQQMEMQRQQFSMQQQQATRGMQMDEERLAIARQQARQSAAEHAATLDAATRQAEADKIEKGLAGAAHFYNQGDQAGYEAFLSQNGMDPEQFPFEAFPAHAAQFEGAIEALRDFEAAAGGGEEPAAVQGLRIRAQEAGLEPGTPEYQDFMLSGGKTETSRVIMGPDGTPIYAEGAAATGGKFTEQQSKDNVYATRAQGALDVLEPVADTLTSRGERAAEMVPFGLARGAQSGDFQVAQQAGMEFLQAILRKDTGAAITDSEMDSYGRTYLPFPGDGPEVLATKKASRRRALEAIKAGMSPQQILAQELALRRTEEATGASEGSRSSRGPETTNPYSGMSDQEFSQIDLGSLSSEELDQLLEAHRK